MPQGLLVLLAMAVATACGYAVQPSAHPAPGTGDGLAPADESREANRAHTDQHGQVLSSTDR